MKSNRKHPVLMLLAIVLMALISIHGCGLDNSADADLLLEEQMIKDGTHPILGSWRLYAFVSADGSSKVARPTIEDCKTCYTIVIKQDKTIEGKPTINEITGYFNLKNNTIKLWWATEAYTIEPEDERLLEEIVPLINKFKVEDDQLFLFYPENNYLLFHRTIEES
ncbi:MAG: hypothetical protein IPI37_00565 [Bacteroidales bacterium]|jgi:hypothetical protein|nr:hypothetical protein [Bacteroidales bacterium]MBK7731298.1 hypothetical protein [Bacteroidales bacterium]HQB52947.1 hypothetical protein [Bacteroidales bacterium]